jgi:hypothetical protein
VPKNIAGPQTNQVQNSDQDEHVEIDLNKSSSEEISIDTEGNMSSSVTTSGSKN